MPAHRHPYRSTIVAMFRRGEFASINEAVAISGIKRGVIWRWLKIEGVDVETSRLRYLGKLHLRMERELQPGPIVRRPSKAELRKQTEKAVREFNERNRKP